MPPASSRVRPAVVADVPVILQLVRELAEYEKALHEVDATAEQLEQAESAVRASRQFRPDYGIDGPHVPRRLSMLQRRRVRNAIDILACLAVILIVLVLAFHQINLANLFR